MVDGDFGAFALDGVFVGDFDFMDGVFAETVDGYFVRVCRKRRGGFVEDVPETLDTGFLALLPGISLLL